MISVLSRRADDNVTSRELRRIPPPAEAGGFTNRRIDVGLADTDRNCNVRYYGYIGGTLNDLNCLVK